MKYRFASRAAQAVKSKPAAKPAGIIDLSGGFAFPAGLPDIGPAAVVAADKYRKETLQYSSVFGIDDLRDEIVTYVAREGVKCTRDNVIVVNGAKHGLDLTCRVFIEPNDLVVVTSPTYLTAIDILKTHQARFLTVSQDEQGLQTDELEKRLLELERDGKDMPKLLFDVPDFHNPTGITMSEARRGKLVALAERFGFMIVEDDPYRKIRFDGEPVLPIKSFDRKGVVVALGTAAKILAPGLRIGWIIADEEIVKRIAAQKADGGSSPFNQRIFVELLRSGDVDEHAHLITKTLKKHCEVMIEAFAEYLPDVTVRRPSGGYYLWAELPKDVDGDVLAGLGATHGVLTYSGTRCFADEPKRNFLRLCYSFAAPDAIKEGVKRLGEAYKELSSGLGSGASAEAAKRAQATASY